MNAWPLELKFQKEGSQIGTELKICGEESSELLEYFQMYNIDNDPIYDATTILNNAPTEDIFSRVVSN